MCIRARNIKLAEGEGGEVFDVDVSAKERKRASSVCTPVRTLAWRKRPFENGEQRFISKEEHGESLVLERMPSFSCSFFFFGVYFVVIVGRSLAVMFVMEEMFLSRRETSSQLSKPGFFACPGLFFAWFCTGPLSFVLVFFICFDSSASCRLSEGVSRGIVATSKTP